MKHLFLYDGISYARVTLLRELFYYIETFDDIHKHFSFEENLNFSIYLHDLIYTQKYSFETINEQIIFKNEYKEIIDKEIAKMLLAQ